MILITYGIDQTVYDHPSSVHNIISMITMYAFQRKKLVHVQFGKLLQNQLENRLESRFRSDEQFMLEHENGFIEPLTHKQFQEKRKQFDPKRTVKEQELWERYCYTDKRKRQEIVQIAILIQDDCTKATIEFESQTQYQNFVQPAWLICLDNNEIVSDISCSK